MRWVREDLAGGARLYLWRDSLKLVGRHWTAGTGPDTFSVEFAKVQSPDLSRAFPEFYHESAHNMFLDAATAQGLPGLLILVAAAVMGFRSRTSAGEHVPVLLGGLAAIVISHQFSVFTVPTALGFWITLAMLVQARPFKASEICHSRMLWLAPLSAALILGAARMTIADRHLAEMYAAVNASRFERAEAERMSAARSGLHADLWYSRKLLATSQTTSKFVDSIARTERALAAGIGATITADDPYNAWMNLGLIYATLNNANRTEYCIREAVSASPNWYKPHLALARLLLATNRREEGKRELQVAKDLNPTAHF
jgi:hypothetical protein